MAIQLIQGCHQYARKSASRAVLGRVQLTLHATRGAPHVASHLVLPMFAWSVKTRRAPSRHCRDARVYGHTTTAMHDNENPPPSSRRVRFSFVCFCPLWCARDGACMVRVRFASFCFSLLWCVFVRVLIYLLRCLFCVCVRCVFARACSRVLACACVCCACVPVGRSGSAGG